MLLLADARILNKVNITFTTITKRLSEPRMVRSTFFHQIWFMQLLLFLFVTLKVNLLFLFCSAILRLFYKQRNKKTFLLSPILKLLPQLQSVIYLLLFSLPEQIWVWMSLYRNSQPEKFCKKGVLKQICSI